ncbi:MAG: EamA family transporter [Bacillota bacterium]|nr:EamA family transporter [Bacillota bacterium]
MTFGLQFSTASKSSIVIGSNPILVVLFSYLFLREPLGKRKFFGLCLALSGVFLAVSGADFLSGLRLHFSLNDSILVLGAVLWAAYTLLSRQYSHKLPYLEGLFWIFGLGALFSLPLLLPRIPLLLELSGLQWFWLLFCGLVPGGISYFLWNRCLSVLGASTCSICASFMPVSSGILAVLFLGEPLLWTQIIGLILVIAGVLLGLYRNKLPINYETDVSLSAREKAD